MDNQDEKKENGLKEEFYKIRMYATSPGDTKVTGDLNNIWEGILRDQIWQWIEKELAEAERRGGREVLDALYRQSKDGYQRLEEYEPELMANLTAPLSEGEQSEVGGDSADLEVA